MSVSIAATPAITPSAALHAHGHGHKKGGIDPTTDSSSDPNSASTASTSSASTQNLFSTLLSSAEEVIGATNPAVAAVKAVTGF